MGRLSETDSFPWLAVEGVTRGRSHIREGTECQDRTFVLRSNGTLALALADGAGSAPQSGKGAGIVVKSICDFLCAHFAELYEDPKTGRLWILRYLRERLKETAFSLGCVPEDLASTLLAVCISGNRFLALHLGDGVIGYTRDGVLSVLTEPQNGEFVNTTYFVTSKQAEKKLRILQAEDSAIDGFALMSDGTAAGLYDRRERRLVPVTERLIRRLSVTSEAFLRPVVQRSLDDVLSMRTQDDCSLILAARHSRAYPDLTEEEQNAFFGIEVPSMELAAKARQRYVNLLDALESPQSERALAKTVGLSPAFFHRRCLMPMVALGYVVWESPNHYRRTIEPLFSENLGNEPKAQNHAPADSAPLQKS